jgi:hypothetical protein
MIDKSPPAIEKLALSMREYGLGKLPVPECTAKREASGGRRGGRRDSRLQSQNRSRFFV